MKIVFYHMKGTTLIHFYFQKTTLIFSKTTYIQNENCVLSYEKIWIIIHMFPYDKTQFSYFILCCLFFHIMLLIF